MIQLKFSDLGLSLIMFLEEDGSILIQLPYDHDHDGPFLKMGNLGNLRVFYTSSLFDPS
jgi:hypothetical protein